MEENYGESVYSIFHQVIKLNFSRAHRILDVIGIHPGQAHLLGVIVHEKGISQNQLAKVLSIKPATVTGMIKKLEKAKLIERKVDEADQRVLRVYPTKEGEELGLKLKAIYDEIKKEVFKNFTEEELIIFRRLLIQMKTNLEKNDGEEFKNCPEFK